MLLELIVRHFAQEARIIGGGIDQDSDSLGQSRWYWWRVRSILPTTGSPRTIMCVTPQCHLGFLSNTNPRTIILCEPK
jgi:hypothetical protein